MGSDKLQMEFITENFLYKNVYLSYGYFDSIDDFINSLMDKFISFVYRKFNEINAIDIMLEYPIGTFYIESMPNKEKIEETLTRLEWYLNYLNTSSSPNNPESVSQKLKDNPEINKNFNVLLDFKISESKVHTLGVIAWVMLG